MRVIAGEARGRRLEALPGTDVTRPTLDQVKEAMFSIVQFYSIIHNALIVSRICLYTETRQKWRVSSILQRRAKQ